jgi:hypothetical protein
MRVATASVCALVVIASDGGLAWQLTQANTAAIANFYGARLAASSSSAVCRGCGCRLQMAAGRGEGGRVSGGSKSKGSGRGAAAPKKRDIDMEKAVRTYQVMEDRKGKKKERKQVSVTFAPALWPSGLYSSDYVSASAGTVTTTCCL